MDTETIFPTPSVTRSPDGAFKLLADETRLSIMRSLWDAQDPLEPNPIPFSEVLDMVDVDDPGRLNYHLGKLAEHYLTRTDDGYELTEAGKRIMRVVISGSAIDDVSIHPVEVNVSCMYYDGPTQISYEDGWLSHRCVRCSSRCVVDYPPSVLSHEELPPAGLLNRTTDEIYCLNRIWITSRERAAKQRVCPECSGPMPVSSIRICDDHDPDPTDEEVCASCGSFFGDSLSCVRRVQVLSPDPTLLYPPSHPAVIAFYYDYGIEFDIAAHEHRAHHLDYREAVVSEEPIRIQTVIPLESEEHHFEYDGQMQVVSADRR